MLAHWALKRIKIQTQTNQTHTAAPARTWHTVEKDGPTRAPCGVFPTFMKQPSSIPPLSPRVHRTVVMNREQAGHPRVKPESGCGVHSSCAQSSHRFFLFVAVSIPTCLSGLTSPFHIPRFPIPVPLLRRVSPQYFMASRLSLYRALSPSQRPPGSLSSSKFPKDRIRSVCFRELQLSAHLICPIGR